MSAETTPPSSNQSDSSISESYSMRTLTEEDWSLSEHSQGSQSSRTPISITSHRIGEKQSSNETVKQKKTTSGGLYGKLSASTTNSKSKKKASKSKKGYIRACSLTELRQQKSIVITYKRMEIALFMFQNENGKTKVYAIDNICSHAKVPLIGGDIEDIGNNQFGIKCPGHGICFSFLSGKATKSKKFRQRVFPLQKVGSEIWIQVKR
mmetsp:Transcript_15986/g.23899  ORF Transcript_15986/g.23899 Transcript_15986/m.23899 type:complete len:208 (+) Transcript_15986:48-671(+)